MDYDPEFFDRRRAMAPDLEPTSFEAEGYNTSRFEDNYYHFEVDDNGVVQFGRWHKREKPNVNVALIDTVWGLIGLNTQMRRAAGGEFAQPVMGFNLKVGENLLKGEDMLEAAKREAREENGIKSESVRSIELLGRVMVNQTSFTSDTALLVMDCDHSNVASDLDVAEGIRSAFWIKPGELLSRIKAGTYEGVRYDNGPLLWTMMTLMAHKPEFFMGSPIIS